MANLADFPDVTRVADAVQFHRGRAVRVRTECSFLSPRKIQKIEERYGATYVFESQLKLRSDRWSEFSAAVFYCEEPHPKGSNWFGIWENHGRFMISNATSAVDEPFFGAVAENGDVIFSRHCSDCRESEDRTVFVDGGRSHFRSDLEHEIVKMKVVRDRVVIIPRDAKIAACEAPFTEELDWDIGESDVDNPRLAFPPGFP